MGLRRQAREYALGYLYQLDFGLEAKTKLPLRFAEHFGLLQAQQDFFIQIVEGVMEHQSELDEEIQGVAQRWKLSRMARVDRVVLRMAAWELKYTPETPYRVIIDEALEIARKYSTTESASFVNGLLDELARRYRTKLAEEA